MSALNSRFFPRGVSPPEPAFNQLSYVHLWTRFKHSQKSNWFSPDGAVRQNWRIFRRNDKYKKFRVFPEVCDSGIFETSEPKTEPPELPKHW